MTTPLDDPLGEAQRRGDFWKRRAERLEADRNRANKALAQAQQRATALDAVLDRLRQMTDHWEKQLPEVIRTPAVVSAIRAALEQADDAPPLDHRQILDRAVAHLRSIPVDCTALTGPVWYGQGWNGAINELEEYTDRVSADTWNDARKRVTALHEPVQHMGQTWCGECSVRRRTGPKAEEWMAFIPHPCPTLNALENKEA